MTSGNLLGLSWTRSGTLWGGVFGPLGSFGIAIVRPRASQIFIRGCARPPRRPSWAHLERFIDEVASKFAKNWPLGPILLATKLSEDDFRWRDNNSGWNLELCVLPPNPSTGLSTSQRLSNDPTFDNQLQRGGCAKHSWIYIYIYIHIYTYLYIFLLIQWCGRGKAAATSNDLCMGSIRLLKIFYISKWHLLYLFLDEFNIKDVM